VLELSQTVIAELKSYSQPPALVHHVMIATFLLLGTSERETKSWQATQVDPSFMLEYVLLILYSCVEADWENREIESEATCWGVCGGQHRARSC